jgi:hypothetical protein
MYKESAASHKVVHETNWNLTIKHISFEMALGNLRNVSEVQGR